MKRLHVHIAVDDLARATHFYSTLFAAEPSVSKPDYAKWMLDDPRLNLAISQRGAAAGVEHLGIQAEDEGELAEVYQRLADAGAPVLDAPHGNGWLLDRLGGEFVLITHAWQGPVPAGMRVIAVDGLAAERLALPEGAACLVRPDQYVAARWLTPDAARIEAALQRAKGGKTWLN